MSSWFSLYEYYIYDNISSLVKINNLNLLDTSKVTNMVGMFYQCAKLTSLNLSNAVFNQVEYYADMLTETNANITIYVKDIDAETFINARLEDTNITTGTVTIVP